MATIKFPKATSDAIAAARDAEVRINQGHDFEKDRRAEAIIEKKLLQRYATPVCHLEEDVPISKIREQLSGLNKKEASNAVTRYFFDSDIIKSFICIARSILLDSNEGMLASNQLIRRYISNLRMVGHGTFGNAILSDLVTSDTEGVRSREQFESKESKQKLGSAETNIGKDLFILKTSRNEKGNNMLIHEATIATLIINAMRMYIPNFAIVYGLFECAPPIFDEKNVSTWCTDKRNQSPYVVYENIPHDVTFEQYCRRCTFKEFICAYLQLIHSLEFAYDYCGFTHYDAHGSNILMRKILAPSSDEKGSNIGSLASPMFIVPSSSSAVSAAAQSSSAVSSAQSASVPDFWIKYPAPLSQKELKDRWIRCPGGKIPTFIDYGVAYIYVSIDSKAMHIGYPTSQDFRYPDKSHPFHDLYKLLCFSIQYMADSGNNECLKRTVPLLSFFNDVETYQQIIALQRNWIYDLPMVDMEPGLFRKYINFVIQTSHVDDTIITETKPDGPILNSVETEIVTSSLVSRLPKSISILNKLGVYASKPILRDIIDFYAQFPIIYQDKSITDDDKKTILSDFYNNLDEMWDREVDKQNIWISLMTEIKFKGIDDYFGLVDTETYLKYINNFKRMCAYFDTMFLLSTSMDAMDYIKNFIPSYKSKIEERLKLILIIINPTNVEKMIRSIVDECIKMLIPGIDSLSDEVKNMTTDQYQIYLNHRRAANLNITAIHRGIEQYKEFLESVTKTNFEEKLNVIRTNFNDLGRLAVSTPPKFRRLTSEMKVVPLTVPGLALKRIAEIKAAKEATKARINTDVKVTAAPQPARIENPRLPTIEEKEEKKKSEKKMEEPKWSEGENPPDWDLNEEGFASWPDEKKD